MDYEKDDEFYDSIKKKKDEIKASDVSDEDKNESYLFLEEKIQEYAKLKIIYLKNQILTSKLNSIQKILNQKLEGIVSITERINLEEIIKKQKINRKIIPFPGYIPFSDN